MRVEHPVLSLLVDAACPAYFFKFLRETELVTMYSYIFTASFVEIVIVLICMFRATILTSFVGKLEKQANYTSYINSEEPPVLSSTSFPALF